jgi:hypothetical protein
MVPLEGKAIATARATKRRQITTHELSYSQLVFCRASCSAGQDADSAVLILCGGRLPDVEGGGFPSRSLRPRRTALPIYFCVRQAHGANRQKRLRPLTAELTT